MELVKKNIHMDRMKCKASTQITLEEDINISDSRPDALQIVWNRGNIVIEEVKVSKDHVNVNGKLQVAVLYQTEEEAGRIASMESELPFEEQIYMDGVESGDSVEVQSEMEDLTTGLINSRKISVQSLLSLLLSCENLYDEEIAVALEGEEPVEYRKKTLQISPAIIRKKDVFRIKEETEIPTSYPNIFSVIWNDLSVENVDFKLAEDKINIQGEIRVFFLYRAESEENEVCHYETTLPFSGTIECSGCREGMIPEISWQVGRKDVEVRPDFDGEERVFTFELSLDLSIRVNTGEEIELLADLYGVNREIETITREAIMARLHTRCTGKTKVSGRLVSADSEEKINKILQLQGKVQIEEQVLVEEGILLSGHVEIRLLYEGSARPYGSLQEQIPFSYLLEAEELPKKEKCKYLMTSDLEQLSAALIDSGEAEAKCVLIFRTNIYNLQKEKVIEQINVCDIDMEKLNALPSMAVYVVGKGESLWDIGKHYYVTIEKLMEINDLHREEVQQGDKILVVKGS